MIKDIVVNLGLGERDPAGDFAISVADTFEAHLLGVAFIYDPIIPGTVMGGIPPEFIESQRRESEKNGRLENRGGWKFSMSCSKCSSEMGYPFSSTCDTLAKGPKPTRSQCRIVSR